MHSCTDVNHAQLRMLVQRIRQELKDGRLSEHAPHSGVLVQRGVAVCTRSVLLSCH